MGQFQPMFVKSILGWNSFKFLQMKGHFFSQVEIIITKQQKYLDEILKSSPQPLVQFQPNLAYGILGLSSFTFVQIKGLVPFQGEKIKKQQNKIDKI